ncbi:MAG: sigma-70 family RNA polymerase sigma factor [Candidatus Promineifilaceae bacterium]
MDEEPDHDSLAACLKKGLEQSNIEDPQLFQNIHTILYRSLEYGRAQRILGDDPDEDACREYVDQVITNYRACHSLVARLERSDPEAWNETIKKIHAWTNGYLRHRKIYGPLKEKCIEECVPNAVIAYLTGTYHYDVEFDAWFCVLVHNTCRKHIKEQLRSSRPPQKETISLDQLGYLLETLGDKREMDARRQRELRAALLTAVEQLSSEARRELIIRHYFLDHSFKEIAEEMDKTMNAVYKLHFDALNELETIVEELGIFS